MVESSRARFGCPEPFCVEDFSRLSDLVFHLRKVHNWNDKAFDKWLEPHFKLSHVGTTERAPLGDLQERETFPTEGGRGSSRSPDDLTVFRSCFSVGWWRNTLFPKENERLSSVCSLRKEEGFILPTENVFYGGGGCG